MFPWLWFWAPQLYLPWSGDVAQRIDPDTHWFFSAIKPEAGNAGIEEKAFAVASYGRQLGLLAEVLVALAEQSKPLPEPAARSLAEVKRIQAAIARIKDDEYAMQDEALEATLRQVKRRGGARHAALSKKLRPLLSNAGA
jgi:hypothetical protein